jgi:hypothetical protein
MLLEKILEIALDKYLGDFVENFDRKSLKVGVWGGQ